jgi:hypothetical protein
MNNSKRWAVKARSAGTAMLIGLGAISILLGQDGQTPGTGGEATTQPAATTKPSESPATQRATGPTTRPMTSGRTPRTATTRPRAVRPGKPVDMFYYDLKSEKENPMERLFIGPSNELPPIKTPSGKQMANGEEAGVRAYVFTCGDAKDRSTWFIGYLEFFTLEAREARINPPKPDEANPRPMDLMKMDAGHMIASGENLKELQWVPQTSPQGAEIMTYIMKRCGGQPPKTVCGEIRNNKPPSRFSLSAMRARGLEPPPLSGPEPKSGASANFATPASASES